MQGVGRRTSSRGGGGAAVFGQGRSSKPGGSRTRFTAVYEGPRSGSFEGGSSGANEGLVEDADQAARFEEVEKNDAVDLKFGYERFEDGPDRLGWLLTMQPTLLRDSEWPTGRSAVDFYFLQQDGGHFKATIAVEPYFFIRVKDRAETEVEQFLRRKFEQLILQVNRVQKDDLGQPNHLVGLQRTYLQLVFRNVGDLMRVRKLIMPMVRRNQELKADAANVYEEDSFARPRNRDVQDYIIDIREYDIPYYLRVTIDKDLRVGHWYNVRAKAGKITTERREDLVQRAEPVVLAFDIECTKQPLKFPDARTDAIMMISYMIDAQGYLITNREVVSEDIENFEYTPKPEYQGPFIIFNEANEKALLSRFFTHIQEVKPSVIATFNGDSFDWPFVQARAEAHGFDLFQETGFKRDDAGEYQARHASHMDTFRWVKRDSYLPAGSHGLKAVTTAKLGYNPLELDPENMTPFAMSCPQVLASYSVSDAVATYYLYMKYVHPFIFSLCNIIPLHPDDVLRKGSGTLCETLLMVEAYKVNVIMPNKQVDASGKMFEGHLLESETYVGGHVEAIESGVFRSDLMSRFRLDASAFQQLIDHADEILKFAIEVEGKQDASTYVNFDEIKENIVAKLTELRDNPTRLQEPLIYHLDVAAMYPNIILTNRMQPPAMVDETMCAACDFNVPEATCQRRMKWSWRGEFFPATTSEFTMIRNQLESESFPGKFPGQTKRFNELPHVEQTTLLHKRLGDYSRKVYRKAKQTKVQERESVICQRENPFYINTVRDFRDRRYDYKNLHKQWKKNFDDAVKENNPVKIEEAKKMIILYDSLQLAHKCILNSFYGYVMRRGARWYSMEMAGIVCATGASIITMARQLVERIGRPLELDTDGIWCILPGSFPENYTFKTANGGKFGLSFPGAMLNHLVHDKFTNHQYQDLVDKTTLEYQQRSENSIFFEVDGPYRAMILPAAKEEDKLLKKRYAVFHPDGSLAELKGFEVKRRGELKLIKIFQSQIFEHFLDGSSLEECYRAVGGIADQWLDTLYSKAIDMEDHEVIDLLCENRSMSRTLEEYGGQKSTSISTARRLAEFLGDQMVKDKGLTCQFIISEKPLGTPVTERAIPVAIFSAEEAVKKHFLRKWLKDPSLSDFDIRTILDWSYYIERYSSTVQKLITIPAAMQKVSNPVPRVRHPDWLMRRVNSREDKTRQARLSEMMGGALTQGTAASGDVEDMFASPGTRPRYPRPQVTKRRRLVPAEEGNAADDSGVEPIDSDTMDVDVSPPPAAAVEEEEAQAVVVAGTPPDIHEDYEAWMQFSKAKWRQIRAKIKRRRDLGEVPRGLDSAGMERFLHQQAKTLYESPWTVLQLAETAVPGEFRVHVVVGRTVHCLQLTVPRTVFVNTRKEAPQLASKRVSFTLPRDQKPEYLYEITMPETQFISRAKEVTDFFNSAEVEGVYETHVPLLFRALVGMGGSCQVSRARSALGEGDHFSLADVSLRTPPALGHGGIGQFISDAQMRHVYLYHAGSESRHLIAVCCPDTASVVAIFVGPTNANQQGGLPRHYTEARAAFLERQEEAVPDIVNLPEAVNVTLHTVGTVKEAARLAARTILAIKNERRGPVLVSAQCSATLVGLLRLWDEVPVLRLATSASDSQFPALGWERFASRRFVGQLFNLNAVLHNTLGLSHYANLPLCNMVDDHSQLVIDVLLARQLKQNNCLLWVSGSERPDLGGKEADENTMDDGQALLKDINVTGCYRSLTVEFDLLHLAYNTLIESSHLAQEAEGSAFKLLRALVCQWSHEAATAGNVYADLLMLHFYRWLTSGTALLFDPALRSLVQGMMKKVFLMLLGEFKRLGATVVLGNFNRLVVSTSKTSLPHAQAYAAFLTKTIKAKPLFSWLELEPTTYWDTLHWMDEANYAGVLAGSDRVEMHWNMADYLPPASRRAFVALVGDYILQTLNNVRDMRKARGVGRHSENVSADLSDDENAMDIDAELPAAAAGTLAAFAEFVQQRFGPRLLSVLPQLQNGTGANFEFPQLPGSHLSMDSPALELVKQVVQVLQLDRELASAAHTIRKNALTLLGVGEFAAAAAFVNPCLSYRLSEVICTYCCFCRDVDLCRDKHLVIEAPADGAPAAQAAAPAARWLCPLCKNEYDRAAIEQQLVASFSKRVAQYQLQDLKCVRCRMVKPDNLAEFCVCSGRFVNAQSSPADFATFAKTFRNIAAYHAMPVLMHVIEWVTRR